MVCCLIHWSLSGRLAVASRIDRLLFCMIGRIPFRTLLKRFFSCSMFDVFSEHTNQRPQYKNLCLLTRGKRAMTFFDRGRLHRHKILVAGVGGEYNNLDF